MNTIPKYAPFTARGRDDTGRYHYVTMSGAEIDLAPDEHTKYGLLQLAGPEFWRDVAPAQRGMVDWDAAASLTMASILKESKS